MEQTAKKIYSGSEVFFAWASLFAGFALWRILFEVPSPVGMLVLTVALFVVTSIVVIIKGAKFSFTSVFAAASALAASASFFLTSNGFIHFVTFNYIAVAYLYFVYAVFGNCVGKPFSNLIVVDFIKAVFIMPFVSFVKIFVTLFRGRKEKRGDFGFFKVLLGFALALIPTVIVFSLLSYDEGFKSIFKDIFKLDVLSMIKNVFSVIFGIPVGMYIYGAFNASIENKCPNVMKAEPCRKFAAGIKILPAITSAAAVLPVIVLYVVFFISQWKYYVSAFTGVLPKGITYADYAREGFFELCAVAFINLLIIIVISVFTVNKGKNGWVRAASSVLSVCTFVLIATAASKMVLYIQRFGLTPLRVYSSWFMAVIALIFLLILAKQIFAKFKVAPTALVVSVIMFVILGASGADSQIAKYNVDRYIDGSLETVDVYFFEELGADSMVQVVRLAQKMDKEQGTSFAEEIKNYNEEIYWEKEWDETLTDYDQLVHITYDYIEHQRKEEFVSRPLPVILADMALKEAGVEL